MLDTILDIAGRCACVVLAILVCLFLWARIVKEEQNIS